VIEDREIWACANQILRRYAEAAWLHASQRADELSASGDTEGQRTWIRILRRIETLERMSPDAAVH